LTRKREAVNSTKFNSHSNSHKTFIGSKQKTAMQKSENFSDEINQINIATAALIKAAIAGKN
jgi:hypothetical protein